MTTLPRNCLLAFGAVIGGDWHAYRSCWKTWHKASESNFATATYEDAESFLGRTSRATVACLVADMRMPGMSGVELYQTLLASDQGIPTVIITAHPEEVAQARGHVAGLTCYLIKPFAPDELLECVNEALAKSRTPGAIPKY